jgi:hypothetical protein
MSFLSFLGVIFLICLAVGTAVGLLAAAVELVDYLKRQYQIKHRFDGPPTAKCYCKDCTHHSDESMRCYKFDGWYTADEWFCWDAEPRKEEKE